MNESALRYFVGGWMHQDLDLDYPDIAGAAADFASHPPHDVEGLLQELRDVVTSCRGEGQLHRAFDRMQAQYVPQKPGELRRQLLAALDVLEQSVRERVLLRSALAELLRSWYAPVQDDARVLSEMTAAERAALAAGLRAMLTSGIRDAALSASVRELSGEAVAARLPEVRPRLQATLDLLERPDARASS